MYLTKSEDAVQYQSPGHHHMQMHRIQGQSVTPLEGVWAARLTLEPGGFVEPTASPAAKLYIVDSGELEFRGGEQTVLIKKGDSVFVNPNEIRSFKSVGDQIAVMHLVMLENYATQNSEN